MDLSLSLGVSAARSFPDLAGQLFALRSCALLSLASYTVALLGRVDSDVNATHGELRCVVQVRRLRLGVWNTHQVRESECTTVCKQRCGCEHCTVQRGSGSDGTLFTRRGCY